MLRQTREPRSATDHPDASADGRSRPGIRRLHPSTTLARLHASATGLVPVSEVAHDANEKGTVSYWHLWTSCSTSVGPAGKETRSPRSRGPPGTGIPGFGLRILANGIQQPPRRLRDTRPCRPPGTQDPRTHAPAGTASPRARLNCQPASAALTDETPPQTSDLLRQNTRQGWRPNGTDCPETRTLRSARQGLPGQDRQGSPRNRLRGTTAGRDVHTAPLGTVLLREWAPVGSARTDSFGCRGWHEGGRSRASGRSRTWFAREAGLGRVERKRAHASRTRMLTCPSVGCSGTSAPRQATIDARRKQTLDRAKPKEASGGASAETSARRYGLDGGPKP